MKRVMLTCLLACTFAGRAWGGELSFSVSPGGGTLLEGGTVQATAPFQSVSTYHLQPPPGTHRYVLRRPPFDDLTLDVRSDGTRWLQDTPSGPRPLDARSRLDMSRTLWLRVVPEPTGLHASVAGREVALARLPDGRVVIPAAWQPPTLFLERDGFEPYVLTIPAGALDVPGAAWPEHPLWLKPRYGPFSYWPVDLGAGLSALGLLAWRRRPRRRASRPAPPPVPTPSAGWQGSLDWLSGRTVTGVGGGVWRLESRLGQGGMGIVLAAGDAAVKILLSDRWHEPEYRARFEREARLSAAFQHENLVRTLDWGQVRADNGDQRPFLAMERLHGVTLRAALADRRPWEVARAVPLLAQVLAALAHVHAHGVVHRDVKPENLMLAPDGTLKLMDFGIAREEDVPDLTRTKAVLGTPRYMSPEHFNARHTTARSDLWSVGAIAYEMLAGRAPYEADDLWTEVGLVMMGGAVPLHQLNAGVPAGLSAVVMAMLDVDPARRPADADACREALLGAVESGRRC